MLQLVVLLLRNRRGQIQPSVVRVHVPHQPTQPIPPSGSNSNSAHSASQTVISKRRERDIAPVPDQAVYAIVAAGEMVVVY